MLTGRLLRGEGRAAGPGEMLISPVRVEYWFIFFSPGSKQNIINKSKAQCWDGASGCFSCRSDLIPWKQ